MSAFDGNQDGRLNLKERADGLEFRYADRNDDGAMNRAEFARVESNCRAREREVKHMLCFCRSTRVQSL